MSGPGFHTPSPPSTPGSAHSSPSARWADSPANTPQLLLEEMVEPAPRAKYTGPSTGIRQPLQQTLETATTIKSPHRQTLETPAATKSPHRQTLETPAAAKSPHRQTSITPPAAKSPYQKTVDVAVSPVRDHTLRRQVSSDSLRLSPECKTPAYLQKSRSYKDVVPREPAKGNGFRGKATYSSPPPSAYPTEGQQGGLREACERLVQRNQPPSATFHLPTELYKPPTTPLLTARPGMHSFAQSFGDFPKNTSSLLPGPCPRYPMNANRMQYVPEESRFTPSPPATLRQTGRVRVNQLWNGPPTLTGNSARDTRRSAPMRGRMANVSATGNPMRILPYKPNPSTASITEEPQKTVKNSRHVTITGHMAGQPGNTKSLPNVDAHFFER